MAITPPEKTRYVWGIDPGPQLSAAVMYEPAVRKVCNGPLTGIFTNTELLDLMIPYHLTTLAIEKVVCYGMGVGEEVFETVYFTGRLVQAWIEQNSLAAEPIRIPRLEIKLTLCHDSRAKDGNIRQALIDLFGPGKAVAIGTKKFPGPLYRIKKHLWAALAVAVVAGQQQQGD